MCVVSFWSKDLDLPLISLYLETTPCRKKKNNCKPAFVDPIKKCLSPMLVVQSIRPEVSCERHIRVISQPIVPIPPPPRLPPGHACSSNPKSPNAKS